MIQPASFDAEAGILYLTFDKTELRLITGNADKKVHIYEQENVAGSASKI